MKGHEETVGVDGIIQILIMVMVLRWCIFNKTLQIVHLRRMAFLL